MAWPSHDIAWPSPLPRNAAAYVSSPHLQLALIDKSTCYVQLITRHHQATSDPTEKFSHTATTLLGISSPLIALLPFTVAFTLLPIRFLGGASHSFRLSSFFALASFLLALRESILHQAKIRKGKYTVATSHTSARSLFILNYPRTLKKKRSSALFFPHFMPRPIFT